MLCGGGLIESSERGLVCRHRFGEAAVIYDRIVGGDCNVVVFSFFLCYGVVGLVPAYSVR